MFEGGAGPPRGLAGVTRLEDKAPGRLVRVDPAYTSQTYNACGYRAPGNRESQAVFRCVACGHRANADVNAARNIKDTAVGRTVAARGGTPSGGPVNREPQPALLSV
ncbi:zinc ribbon domain-containing protein [Actinomadura latina]|uniref:zinc ribbon domain-containing protein n=1 Tax=Actinomadura latina TaxID=163603 RepID=UPI000829FE5B|nr:zinc ribbon domain-containing protein [Actinomadura latina]